MRITEAPQTDIFTHHTRRSRAAVVLFWTQRAQRSETYSLISTAQAGVFTLIAATHRAQADALEIEAQAKRWLADEYDAAQERGEIRKNGERSFSNSER